MAMIYRRTPHGSGARLTTTIPLSSDSPQRQLASSQQLDVDNNDKDDDDLASPTAPSRGRLGSRWMRCRAWRCGSSATGVNSPLPTRALTSTSNSHTLSYRLCQILWQALLVYAFFGLPVLGRILNFCRYFHRFTVPSIATGLLVGFFQDFAIFVQASTVIVLIKALLQPISIHRRLSAMAAASASSSSASASTTSLVLGGSGSGFTGPSSLAQERYPHSYPGGPRHVHLPVYFPVRTNDYEMHTNALGSASGATSSETDSLDVPHANQPKHLTLVASSSSTITSFPWSLSSSTSPMSPAAIALIKIRNVFAKTLTVVLVKVVLILATIASVADFCLQVTMHPRLNRAFVEIFFNYMGQFTGSLMDEEVLTPPVVFVWATYVVLVTTMTYGFYSEKLPFLPDLVFCSPSSGGGEPYSSWCCVRRVKRLSAACTGLVKRRSYRKDSSLPPPSSSGDDNLDQDSTTSAGFIKSLYRSYWRRKDSDIVILNETSSGLTSSVSAANRSHQRRRRNSSHGHGTTMLGLHSTSVFSGTTYNANSSSSWMKPKSPLGIVLHCIVVSVFVTLGALCISLIVHTSTGAMSRNASKHHALIGVDMQLMSNPMFSLQTENFFTRKSRVGADHINCTLASAKVLSTLGRSEVYDTNDLGNDDSCALLWRKTTAYQGETWWDINWNVSRTDDSATAAPSLSPSDAEQPSSPTPKTTSPRQPNIIVINMESWRHLDVGVLGAAEKKRKYGKSVTPNFDRFSKEGVLYRKHYTQCVQTTRTLLTTLFGMLPSCTETTAIKMYSTGLAVQGLPQFLKSRGYFNMFWSAVDLTWEYWDKFLLGNGFDKLVDDQKVRKMLHDVQNYKDRDDDHFSWGMHDHLSFDMLLYALEFAKNSTQMPKPTLDGGLSNVSTTGNATLTTNSAALEIKRDELVSPNGANASAVDSTPSQEPAENGRASLKPSSKMRGQVDRENQGAKTHSKKSILDSVDPGKIEPANIPGSTRRIRPTIGWEGLREPYFIDMYTITSHNPWALPLDYEVPDLTELYTRFNKRYIDAMYFSDDMLGRFIDSMRTKGLMNNTVVIIEGDHGYGRLEHDNNPSIADSAVYDEATRVPFLILADDFLTAEQRGIEVDQLTMQSDLMATIADLLGVSEQDPLLQHGFGHSMRRKRGPRAPVKDVDFDVIHKNQPDVEKERRVVMCNPFNGLTKGVRTEELKYVYNPDGSFKVFELDRDPIEKKPVRSGYDYEQMDDDTREVLDFVSEQVDLNQFLFETNKFTTPIPTPIPSSSPRSRSIEEAELVLKQKRSFDTETGLPAIAVTADPPLSSTGEAQPVEGAATPDRQPDLAVQPDGMPSPPIP